MDRIFKVSGVIGLLATAVFGVMMALGVGGSPAFLVVLIAVLGNLHFIVYQARASVAGTDAPMKEFLLSTGLSFVALGADLLLMFTHFAVLLRVTQ